LSSVRRLSAIKQVADAQGLQLAGVRLHRIAVHRHQVGLIQQCPGLRSTNANRFQLAPGRIFNVEQPFQAAGRLESLPHVSLLP